MCDILSKLISPLAIVRCVAVATICSVFFASAAVAAATHYFSCAKTAQELQADLTASSDGGAYSGDDNFIVLAEGVYSTGTATAHGPFSYSSTAATGSLSISGGSDANCGGFTGNPLLAKLDGAGTTQVLNIVNRNASVTVSNLTIQNGFSNESGGGLSIDSQTVGGPVYIRGNVIRGNHTTEHDGGLSVGANGTGQSLTVVANLIINNEADQNEGAGSIIVGSGLGVVTHNTISMNSTSAGKVGGLLFTGPGGVISQNIFWQNPTFGLAIGGRNNTTGVYYNDYGSVVGNNAAYTAFNLSTDPQFRDVATNDFRLAGTSPLLAAVPVAEGVDATPYDIAYHRYPEGGYVDLGAYEDTIFSTDFDAAP
jgi:hypothetical protein